MPDEQQHPGARLGLPAAGVGAVVSFGPRLGAFVVDIALSAVAAFAVTAPEAPQNWSLVVWAVLTVVTVAVFGQTPGQAALGMRVVPVDGRTTVGLWAVPRTALIFLLVPPLIMNGDGRGLHDRLCRTVVIRSR
ncbi:RDD family protein [Nakamurella flavida]|uniref:RDD family protein n=1 Tax=Nakamurella flavida TaxID=363630 RepID=A0A939BYN4_9ACTN|nr:RDD family protein [Nakamurella flavida]MBM9474868.1 RDD family protein [Nakamurella flavida]MDP9776438.1 putative RDD family membrane protein YckC [Nakamurella flavida]